ncbi:MAG: SCO family protein [Myxococcota bacterium]
MSKRLPTKILRWAAVVSTIALVIGSSSSLSAQRRGERHEPVFELPGLDQIGVDEHLEEQLPTNLPFTDHDGRAVHLSDYFDGSRPVLLLFAYYSCPQLCSLVLGATADGISSGPWQPGNEYEIVTISIDPNDTVEAAKEKRVEMLRRYGGEGTGWHFLVGEQSSIDAATKAAGVRYFKQEQTEQYAHPAVIMFLTPEATLARYLYGIAFRGRDIRLALLEASEGRSITTTEQIIMYCYSYSAEEGGYALMATRIMKVGGALTAGILGFFLLFLWRRELRRKKSESPSSQTEDVECGAAG